MSNSDRPGDRTPPEKKGMKLIFRPYITLKNGKRLYASQIGKKAFPIWVKE